jgi:hypothetical protein
MSTKGHSRRFLFQTALASGPEAPLAPLTVEANLGPAAPLPVFAISLGREDNVDTPVGVVLRLEAFDLSVDLTAGLLAGPPFAARKVLLTETALKVAGFLAVDEDRTWLPSLLFESPLDASVSEPPLTLTSAELIWSSTLVMCLFSISSWPGLPFRIARSRTPWSESTSARLV